MEAMRNEWSDARLDDLNDRVADMGRRMDEGFNRLHEDLRSEIGSVRSELHIEIGSVRGEIASLHRLILQVAGGMFATFAIGFAGLIATRV
jgi:hypothetical protein